MSSLPLIQLQETCGPQPVLTLTSDNTKKRIFINTNKLSYPHMDTIHMTPEEVKNNYEFKVIRRILMDKYNWITNVTVDEKDLNNYNLIFLEIHVDLPKFIKAMDVTPARWLRTFRGDTYSSSFLSTGFNNFDYEDAKVIQDEMEDLMVQVRKTPAIPPELKLPSGRRFAPGQILIPIPEDIEKYMEPL